MPGSKRKDESGNRSEFTVRDVIACYDVERCSNESCGALLRAVSTDGTIATDSLFEGLVPQQSVLKRDQQLSE